MLKSLPITALVPSPTNPRTHFDNDKLRELGESLKVLGQLQPIVVRKMPLTVVPAEKLEHGHDDYFEIVCGHRRYLALEIAKLETAQALVRELSDRDVLEAQIVENGQREDIHPMEECIGFGRILENPEYKALPDPVQTLADKIGKSKSYVYQRLKLSDLTEESRKEFEAGEFSSGHAILVARLTPKDQYDAITYLCFETDWKNVAGVNGHYRGTRLNQGKSVRDLARWITNQKGSDLTKVAWSRDSLTLLPQAGSCAQCEKRENDLCLDKACFEKKQNAHVHASVQEVQSTGTEPLLISAQWSTDLKGVLTNEDYKVVEKEDPNAVPAIWVESGRNDVPIGEVVYVVPQSKESGKQAKPQWQIDAEEKSKRERLNAKIELHARTEAVNHIAGSIPEVWGMNDNHLLRAMALRFVVNNTEKAMDETLLALGCDEWKEDYHSGSNAIKETDRSPTVKRWLECLSGIDLVRAFFRIAAVLELKVNEYSCPDPIIINCFADVTLVDLDFLRREAKDKFTPAAKKSKAPKVVPVQTSASTKESEDPAWNLKQQEIVELTPEGPQAKTVEETDAHALALAVELASEQIAAQERGDRVPDNLSEAVKDPIAEDANLDQAAEPVVGIPATEELLSTQEQTLVTALLECGYDNDMTRSYLAELRAQNPDPEAYADAVREETDVWCVNAHDTPPTRAALDATLQADIDRRAAILANTAASAEQNPERGE